MKSLFHFRGVISCGIYIVSNSVYTYPAVAGLDIEIGKQETIEKVFISETFLAVGLSDPGELIRPGSAGD